MDQSAQDTKAAHATNALLERIFPSLRSAPAAGEGAGEVVTPVVPLYRAVDEHGSVKLGLGGKSLISEESRCALRAGHYRVMLLDMPSHAEAAALALRMTGAVDHIETGKTLTGNGVVLCTVVDESPVPASRKVAFQGEGGEVAIDWHDCRSSKGVVDWKLSLEIPRKQAMAWVLNAPCHNSCSSDCIVKCAAVRARSITKAVAEGLTCDLSASLFQAEFERTMPGARMSVASISVQDVIEALEDMMGRCGHMVALPSADSIRKAITRHLSECALSSQQIAQAVAMTLIGQNSVRAA